MAKTVKKKDSFSKLSFREVLGMQSHRFLKLIVVAVYACISYYIVTYINDINKVEECSKILPIQKNILYGYGVTYLAISVCILIGIILLLLFFTFVFSKNTAN